jgi:hypothetical protein
MKMRENLIDIYKIFTTNETLLRLLYYLPSSAADDPLDPAKPNILDMAEEEKWKIITDRIIPAPKVHGLDKDPKCRICFYPGRRSNTTNYKVADQEVRVDVFTHHDFNNVDLRLSWISDHVDELLFNKPITGIKKIKFDGGNNLSAPEEYLAYSMKYEIGSVKG